MKPLNLQPLYLATQPGRVVAYRDRNGRIPAREWPMSQRECPKPTRTRIVLACGYRWPAIWITQPAA